MTNRDELADLIMDVFDAHDEGHLSTAQDAAQRILTRWRLVPVEEPWLWPSGTTIPTNPDHPGTEVQGRAEWEQHRAADELTHHDIDAGHYGTWHDYDCGALYGDKPHWHPTN